MYSVPYFQLSIIPYSSFQYLMKMYAGVELGKGVQLLSIPYFFKYALSVPAGGGGEGGSSIPADLCAKSWHHPGTVLGVCPQYPVPPILPLKNPVSCLNLP